MEPNLPVRVECPATLTLTYVGVREFLRKPLTPHLLPLPTTYLLDTLYKLEQICMHASLYVFSARRRSLRRDHQCVRRSQAARLAALHFSRPRRRTAFRGPAITHKNKTRDVSVRSYFLTRSLRY